MLRRNPQYLSERQQKALENSIARDGFLSPIIVRPTPRGQYEVLSGNHRLLACKNIGRETISAVVVACDDRTAQKIAVNMNTIHGEPTAELLAPFLGEMSDGVLAQVHLETALLDELCAFDSLLARRLEQLEPPPSLDHASPMKAAQRVCHCAKCGHSHAPAAKRSR